MQSAPPETSTAGISESSKMDSGTLENGIEQNDATINQEETLVTESKVLLNGNAHKESAECDSNELDSELKHENNTDSDPVVINSVNDINVDKKTVPINESNKDEKVLPSDAEERSSENAVPNEESHSSKPEVTQELQSALEITAPLKQEVTEELKPPVEEMTPLKQEEIKEPLEQEITQELKSSITETAPLEAEVSQEPKSSVEETATLEPEIIQEPKSSVEETTPLEPEVTEKPKSSVEETAPVKPERNQEPKSSVEETTPLEPEVTEKPKSSAEETAPLEPEVTQEPDKSSQNIPETSKEDELNEPDEPMDILGNGLLIKKVLKEGKDRTTRPTPGQFVALKTEGKLEDGTIVDRNERIEFFLGDGDVISAWDIAVALMGENEIAELTCDAKYAYGSLGRSPDIPANATIIYTLELLSKENGLDYNSMTLDERMHYGSLKKERGNYLFTRSNYSGAINSYLKAISIIDNDNVTFEEPPQKLQQLLEDKIKCYNNLAAAQLKVEYYDAAITSCEGVLKHHPENVKALFRMGKAYAAKGETKDAIVHMRKALKLEPETKIIHQELSKLTKKLTKETQSERNMYKKMFRTTDVPVQPSAVEHSRWKWPVLAGSLAVVLLSVGVAYFRYRQH